METEIVFPAEARQLLQHVGDTPLIELRLVRDIARDTRLFAKLESVNPGGSIKDRPVARILTQAMADGRFEYGRRLLECVAGNAGISFAMLGAAVDIPVTLVVSGHDVSQAQIDHMAAHGAELIVMDPLADDEAALDEARRLADAFPKRYWLSDQYRNPANWQAHYYGTAVEALKQLESYSAQLPDALVVGVDTGGTLIGMGRRLREANPNVHIAVVVPEGFSGIEGLKPPGNLEATGAMPLTQSLVHEHIPVTLDEARTTSRDLAREGLFVGPSSGAYVYGALKLAATGKYETIMTVLPDTGEHYSSSRMWHRGIVH